MNKQQHLVRIGLAALVLASAGACMSEETEPSGSDDVEVEADVDEDGSQAELSLADQCVNDAGCPQGYMCVKPAFKSNYCAQLCVYDAIGEHNCPPGFDCTRPFFWNRYRCTPD